MFRNEDGTCEVRSQDLPCINRNDFAVDVTINSVTVNHGNSAYELELWQLGTNGQLQTKPLQTGENTGLQTFKLAPMNETANYAYLFDDWNYEEEVTSEDYSLLSIRGLACPVGTEDEAHRTTPIKNELWTKITNTSSINSSSANTSNANTSSINSSSANTSNANAGSINTSNVNTSTAKIGISTADPLHSIEELAEWDPASLTVELNYTVRRHVEP